MMTFDEVAELLALCAVFDQRKGDELDVQAWHMIASDHRWNAAAAKRVVREHYGSGVDRPRLTPAMVTERLKRLRGAAAESFELPRLPDELENADYPAWLREQLADHVDAQLDQWATTGQEPDRAQPVAMGAGSLAEVIAKAPVHVRGELEAAAKKITGRRS